MSRPSSPASSADDEPLTIPSSSKREYLLAQIKQKDAIIESLLKQVCPTMYYFPVSHQQVPIVAQPIRRNAIIDCFVPKLHIHLRPE